MARNSTAAVEHSSLGDEQLARATTLPAKPSFKQVDGKLYKSGGHGNHGRDSDPHKSSDHGLLRSTKRKTTHGERRNSGDHSVNRSTASQHPENLSLAKRNINRSATHSLGETGDKRGGPKSHNNNRKATRKTTFGHSLGGAVPPSSNNPAADNSDQDPQKSYGPREEAGISRTVMTRAIYSKAREQMKKKHLEEQQEFEKEVLQEGGSSSSTAPPTKGKALLRKAASAIRSATHQTMSAASLINVFKMAGKQHEDKRKEEERKQAEVEQIFEAAPEEEFVFVRRQATWLTSVIKEIEEHKEHKAAAEAQRVEVQRVRVDVGNMLDRLAALQAQFAETTAESAAMSEHLDGMLKEVGRMLGVIEDMAKSNPDLQEELSKRKEEVEARKETVKKQIARREEARKEAKSREAADANTAERKMSRFEFNRPSPVTLTSPMFSMALPTHKKQEGGAMSLMRSLGMMSGMGATAGGEAPSPRRGTVTMANRGTVTMETRRGTVTLNRRGTMMFQQMLRPGSNRSGSPASPKDGVVFSPPQSAGNDSSDLSPRSPMLSPAASRRQTLQRRGSRDEVAFPMIPEPHWVPSARQSICESPESALISPQLSCVRAPEWDFSVYEPLEAREDNSKGFEARLLHPKIYHSIGIRKVKLPPSLELPLTTSILPELERRLRCPFALVPRHKPNPNQMKLPALKKQDHRKKKDPTRSNIEDILVKRKELGMRFDFEDGEGDNEELYRTTA